MKKQKKDKRRQSTQQLMGIQKITDYCISTDADVCGLDDVKNKITCICGNAVVRDLFDA